MQFRLHYRGTLKANRGPHDKHELRRHFHKQLRCLWDQIPLDAHKDFLKTPEDQQPGDISLVRQINGFNFAPLVSERIHLVAELRVLILQPEPPGRIVTQTGDIDNRIKTLLDALKVPSEPNALPKGAVPDSDENPFFCLLEDDNLIVSLAVETDRLLEPIAHSSEVELIIHVTTRQLRVLMGTFSLA